MTFKDLHKRVTGQEITQQHKKTLELLLRDKPFWIWDIKDHKLHDIKTKGNCCFNHIIGLPTKEQIEKPIYGYQKLLYDSSLISEFSNPLNHNFKHKHLWVKKATGLGVTEFFLRFMAWLCLKDDTYQSSQICIVTYYFLPDRYIKNPIASRIYHLLYHQDINNS